MVKKTKALGLKITTNYVSQLIVERPCVTKCPECRMIKRQSNDVILRPKNRHKSVCINKDER